MHVSHLLLLLLVLLLEFVDLGVKLLDGDLLITKLLIAPEPLVYMKVLSTRVKVVCVIHQSIVGKKDADGHQSH